MLFVNLNEGGFTNIIITYTNLKNRKIDHYSNNDNNYLINKNLEHFFYIFRLFVRQLNFVRDSIFPYCSLIFQNTSTKYNTMIIWHDTFYLLDRCQDYNFEYFTSHLSSYYYSTTRYSTVIHLHTIMKIKA